MVATQGRFKSRGVGRPTKPAERKRTERVVILVTPDEKQRLNEMDEELYELGLDPVEHRRNKLFERPSAMSA